MTTSKTQPIRIIYFADALCVWAYLSQVRAEELQAKFGTQVQFEWRFFQVFGDMHGKMQSQWRDKGGIEGYAAHVQDVAASFEHIAVNPGVWRDCIPVSSMPAHLYLCAVRHIEQQRIRDGEPESLLQTALWKLRSAFFSNLVDVSRRSGLLALAEQSGIRKELENVLDSGIAHAELSADLQLARDKSVTASPTLIFNEDRQRLTGNVGYRVLEANIAELLRNPDSRQSWC